MSDEPGAALWRWADAVEQPWRNGGGVTRELVSWPAGADAFDWRISIAEVTASGDFSLFPGVDRTIVLLDGPEMTLTVAGASQPLRRFRPFAFDGGLPVSCAVPAGPTRDLNVMTRTGRCRAVVTVVDVDSGWRTPGSREQFVIPLTGPVTVTPTAGDPLNLDSFDLYLAPASTDLVLNGTGPVAHIEIHSDGTARLSG